jgi:myo-inositol 2-dehydrogenase / D-chiro-inositol 1-dehydrogenase
MRASTPQLKPDTEERLIREWVRWKDTSGDFIVEQNCHGLDVLNWFAKNHPLKAVGAGGRRMREIGDNTDYANVTYTYPEGLIGWLLGTQLPPRLWWDVKEQFFGTQGVLEVERSYFGYMAANTKKEMEITRSKREITIDAVEAFFQSIVDKKPFSMWKDSAESTLTAILGRMACELGREVTWEEMLASA